MLCYCRKMHHRPLIIVVVVAPLLSLCAPNELHYLCFRYIWTYDVLYHDHSDGLLLSAALPTIFWDWVSSAIDACGGGNAGSWALFMDIASEIFWLHCLKTMKGFRRFTEGQLYFHLLGISSSEPGILKAIGGEMGARD